MLSALICFFHSEAILGFVTIFCVPKCFPYGIIQYWFAARKVEIYQPRKKAIIIEKNVRFVKIRLEAEGWKPVIYLFKLRLCIIKHCFHPVVPQTVCRQVFTHNRNNLQVAYIHPYRRFPSPFRSLYRHNTDIY